MWIMWLALSALIIGAIISVAARTIASNDDRALGKGIGVVIISIGVALLVGACLSTTPARNDGVVVSWNVPTGRVVRSGIHVTAPWQDVKDWNASTNKWDHLHDACVEGDKSLWVSIAAGRSMCVKVLVEFQATGGKRAALNWAKYGKKTEDPFDYFYDNRVSPSMTGAAISTFADFDPLSTVKADGTAPSPDLNALYSAKLSAAITDRLTVKTGPVSEQGADVTVISVTFGAPVYDKATQTTISAYGQKVLEARNLAVDKSNSDLRNSIAASTGISPYQQRCLDIAEAKSITLYCGTAGVVVGGGK